jgi:protein-tyrosine phosphatase
MCRLAGNDGIRKIVATPHIMEGVYENTKESILGKINNLQEELSGRKIEVRLLPGADIYLTPALIAEANSLTLNNSGKYLLVELPETFVPVQVQGIIFRLLAKGLIPIISHPERNPQIEKNPRLLYEFIRQGALAQLTAAGLRGRFGKRAAKLSRLFLTHCLVQIIATDAHSVKGRPPLLSRAVEVAAKLVGSERARALVTTIPESIIAGENIDDVPAPRELR